MKNDLIRILTNAKEEVANLIGPHEDDEDVNNVWYKLDVMIGELNNVE